MSDESLTREERDQLLAELADIDARLYPEDDADAPESRQAALLRERYYLKLGEYADRLPRVVLSACPHCGEPLTRVFDPYGLDGPWWHVDVEVAFEEPRPCPHFQVLLGAVDLHGREPSEVGAEVKPGPAAPFVVPALLALPGMKAVVGSLALATGDTAYPIAYFSDQPLEPARLHQSWCRDAYWFKDADGNAGWSIANDPYDFDLEPHLAAGRLSWVDLAERPPYVRGAADGSCPLVELPGDRERQKLCGGERELFGLPSGEVVNPFGD
jgi:hypothetical protein